MRRRRPEQQLQRSVLEHLRLRGAPGIFFFHVPNGGARTAIEGAIFRSLGVVAGIPDLLIIRDGRTFALELKSELGRVTPIQTETQQRMQAAGAVVGVARGIDEAIVWLERHGLLRGKAATPVPDTLNRLFQSFAASAARRAGASGKT